MSLRTYGFGAIIGAILKVVNRQPEIERGLCRAWESQPFGHVAVTCI